MMRFALKMSAVLVFGCQNSLPASSEISRLLLKDGWRYQWEGSEALSHASPQSNSLWHDVSLPCLKSAGSGIDKVLWLTVPIPPAQVSDPALFIRVLDHPFAVYRGRQEIYHFGDLDWDNRHFLGYPWHIVPLPAGVTDDSITFKIVPNGSSDLGICGEVYFGSRADHILAIISQDGGRMIVGILAILTALIATIISVGMRRLEPYLSFAGFCVSAGIWVAANAGGSQVKQLIWNEPVAWAYLDLISLYLMPAFLLKFYCSVFSHGIFRPLRVLTFIHFVYAGVALAVSALPNILIKDTLPYFNAVVPLSIGLVIANTIRLIARRDPNAKILCAGLLFFMIFVIHDLMVGWGFLIWTRHILHIGLAALIGVLGVILVRSVHQMLGEQQSLRLEHEGALAMVRTAQMFAHDVRKPFSLLDAGIKVLRGVTVPSEFAVISDQVREDVNRARASVDSMVSDIMEYGSKQALEARDASIIAIIRDAMSMILESRDALSETKGGGLHLISYAFKHKSTVAVDRNKILRVITNIFDNACDACGTSGRIWFNTREIRIGNNWFIEVVIGNDGPPIYRR